MEDKSAPVGANVVIIGGGNLWKRRKKGGGEEEEEEEEEALSENCVTEWLGLCSTLSAVLRVPVPFCPSSVGHTLPPLEPASTILFPDTARRGAVWHGVL